MNEPLDKPIDRDEEYVNAKLSELYGSISGLRHAVDIKSKAQINALAIDTLAAAYKVKSTDEEWRKRWEEAVWWIESILKNIQERLGHGSLTETAYRGIYEAIWSIEKIVDNGGL